MNGRYILDEEGNPKEAHDVLEWAKWFETANRHVADTRFSHARVSTVFLGLDHGTGPLPVLWETIVFGGSLDGEQERYTSKAEAQAGHDRMVERVKGWGGSR